jgi:mRNA interferase RelE/StbE
MALLIQPKAVKAAKGIPRQDWDRLMERLGDIARNPHGKHTGVDSLGGGSFRVRHGVWRAIYEINGRGDVEVIKVGHRREVYRQ